MGQNPAPRVLVVDDDSMVRTLIRRMLEQVGYNVHQAEDGLAAYNLIRQADEAMDLLITDIQMPRMTGAELVQRLRIEYPNLKILCISAYADPMTSNGHYFLPKPFTPKALLVMVEEVLGVCAPEPILPAPKALPADERRRMQSHLQAKVVAAEARLDSACQEYRRLSALCAAVDAGPDSLLALRHVMAAKQTALTDYSRGLQDLIQLLYGDPG